MIDRHPNTLSSKFFSFHNFRNKADFHLLLKFLKMSKIKADFDKTKSFILLTVH